MWRYYELLSNIPLEKVHAKKAQVEAGDIHPKDAKDALAAEIITRFHSAKAAADARASFERVHVRHQAPDAIDEVTVSANGKAEVQLAIVLKQAGLASSNSEARRLITGGGVKVDDERVDDIAATLNVGTTFLIQVGRRKFKRVSIG